MKEALKREILETLLEQGFIEYADKPSEEEMRILEWLYEEGVIDKPREVGGSYGATLINQFKAYNLLEQME